MANKQIHNLDNTIIIYLALFYLTFNYQNIIIIKSFISINFLIFILIFWEYIFIQDFTDKKADYFYTINGLMYVLGLVSIINIEIRKVFIILVLFIYILFLPFKKVGKILLIFFTVLGFFNYIFFITSLIYLAIARKFKFI